MCLPWLVWHDQKDEPVYCLGEATRCTLYNVQAGLCCLPLYAEIEFLALFSPGRGEGGLTFLPWYYDLWTCVLCLGEATRCTSKSVLPATLCAIYY